MSRTIHAKFVGYTVVSTFGVILVRIQSECRENTDQNNSEHEHFSRSAMISSELITLSRSYEVENENIYYLHKPTENMKSSPNTQFSIHVCFYLSVQTNLHVQILD